MKKLVLAMLSALLLSGIVFGFGFPEMLEEELDLSKSEKEGIINLIADHREDMQTLRLDIMDQKLKLKRELIKDAPDMTSVKSILDEKAKLEAKAEFLRIEHLFEMKKVIGDEKFRLIKGHFFSRHDKDGMSRGRPSMRVDDCGKGDRKSGRGNRW